MPAEQKEIERFLEVGAVVMLHTEPARKDGPRFKTVLRGWRKPSHLLLDRPKTDAGLLVALQEGMPIVVRFLHEGRACAFDSVIIDWDTRRNAPYLRITWPPEIQYVTFRKHERVKLQAPCTVSAGRTGTFEGEIRDLSLGGCAVICQEGPGENPSNVRLSFPLPDGIMVEEVRALVRNYRPGPEGVFLGLEFESNQERALNDILFFVTSRLERVGIPEKSSARVQVMVMDEDADFATRLRRCFERRNIDAFIITGTVEGLTHLRGVAPRALLINAGMKDLPAVHTCILLRKTKGFENLGLYLYGGDPARFASLPQEAGIARYFPPKPSLAPDIAFAVGQELDKNPD